VVDLYHGLLKDDRERIVEAYRAWGFKDLRAETIDTLTIWARFIYAPLLEDRTRTIAEGVAPSAYGRNEMWEVKRRLKPPKTPSIKTPRFRRRRRRSSKLSPRSKRLPFRLAKMRRTKTPGTGLLPRSSTIATPRAFSARMYTALPMKTWDALSM